MSEIRRQFGRTLLFVLFLAAPAFTQSEISPDHFPDADEVTAQPASSQAANLDQRIAEQKAILADYRAQIKAKTEQVQAILQSLLRTGNEAGEGEALAIYQKDLEKLQKSLTPAIQAAEVTLARLQNELAMKKSQTRRPARHSALAASAQSGL